MKKINLFSAVVMLLISFVLVAQGKDFFDLSKPQKTIETYFENIEFGDIISDCFYPPQKISGQDKFWIEYKIVEAKSTDKAGEKTYSGILINKAATEVIVEVKMKDPEKKFSKTRFWFLLQEFDGDWKIIEHSHIADANYPSYD